MVIDGRLRAIADKCRILVVSLILSKSFGSSLRALLKQHVHCERSCESCDEVQQQKADEEIASMAMPIVKSVHW